MSDIEDQRLDDGTSNKITRRKFILGVIAGGAVVGATSYHFLAPSRYSLRRPQPSASSPST